MPEGSINVRVDTVAVANEISKLHGTFVEVGNHITQNVVSLGNALHRDNAETQSLLAVLGQKMLDVENAVNKITESAAETELIRSASEFAGQAIAVQRNAKQVRGQFQKSVERMLGVSRQYDGIDSELLESYHRDVRRAGSHIFEIWEDQFQKTIETQAQTAHSSFHESLRRSIDTILSFREKTLSNVLETAKEKLQDFVAKQRAFNENVRDKVVEEFSDGKSDVQIPFYCVETQNSGRSVRLGCDVKTNGGGKDVTYTIENSQLFSDLHSQLEDRKDELDQQVKWQQMTNDEIAEMEKQFAILEEKKYITTEYHKLLCDVLRTYPPQVIEEIG